MEYSVDEYNCVLSKIKDCCDSRVQQGTCLTKYKVTDRCVENKSSANISNIKNKKRRVSNYKPKKKIVDEMRPLLAQENPEYA